MYNDDVIELAWWAVLILVILTALSLGVIALSADHHAKRYYLGPTGESAGPFGPSCVFADQPWEPDSRVFCSPDAQKTITFMQQANAELAKVKR